MNEKNIPVPKPHQRGTQGAMNTGGVGGWPMFLCKVHLSHSVSLEFSWLKIIWNIKLSPLSLSLSAKLHHTELHTELPKLTAIYIFLMDKQLQ